MLIRSIRKPKNITFEDIAESWIANKKTKVKQSTIAIYSYSIKKYLYEDLAKLTIKQLNEYDFNELIEKFEEDLSPKTIRDIVVILKSILRYASEEFDCNVKISKIVLPKLDSEPLMILNKEEKYKLEKFCVNERSLKNLGILICLNTGLRIGEICALKWENIDLERREICIRSTLQRIYNQEMNSTKIIMDTPMN